MRRFLVLLLVPFAATAACSGGSNHPRGTPGNPPTPSGAVSAGWTARLDAVESPRATRKGFVFHSLGAHGTFKVVSVDAANGHVLWSAAASPSLTAPGVAQSVLVVDSGNTVVWMSPGTSARQGDVSITAADATTGRTRWSYGAGAYLTSNPPTACRGGTQICTVGAADGDSTMSFAALDARDGHVISRREIQDSTTARVIADGSTLSSPDPGTIGLLDTDGSLTAVDYDHQLLWKKANSDVFGGLRVSPDYGWYLVRNGDSFIGSIGYEDEASEQQTVTRTPHEPAATAAIEISTGRTLWVRPDTSADCGSVTFDPKHPVLCSGSFTIDATDMSHQKVTDADITLEGIDPSTGRSRWTWHAGNIPSLVVASGGVTKQDATHYTLRNGRLLTTIDLDRGAETKANSAPGWCESTRMVQSSFAIQDLPDTYVASATEPCSVAGRTMTAPATTPSFAGGKAEGMFAWADDTGTVHAVPAR